VLGEYAVVAVDLRVAQVGDDGALEAAYLALLLQLPGPELVLGILDDVLQGEAQHGRVLNLLKVKEEGHLPLQGFAYGGTKEQTIKTE
jgi:hypothetical protein